MSQVNLSSKIYQLNDVNLDKCGDNYNTEESSIVANDILHDILETAMDIAMTHNTKKMNIIDEVMVDENVTEIKEIIEGLSKINVPTLIVDEPCPLDVEMKRLLSDIMSPPIDVPRKDGVGDQAAERDSCGGLIVESEPLNIPNKAVEKKSRITDLVMNSKKVLSNLLDEEDRKKQEEWEESNEHLIRVVELQSKQQQTSQFEIVPENVPLPYDEHEDELVEPPNEERMEEVELKRGGDGDDVGGLDVKTTKEVLASDKCCEKSLTKKKRWNFSFKFFSFRKNRKATVKQ